MSQTIGQRRVLRSLTTRAKQLHPNTRNACKWVLAVRYLRKRYLWVLEGGKPKWGN